MPASWLNCDDPNFTANTIILSTKTVLSLIAVSGEADVGNGDVTGKGMLFDVRPS